MKWTKCVLKQGFQILHNNKAPNGQTKWVKDNFVLGNLWYNFKKYFLKKMSTSMHLRMDEWTQFINYLEISLAKLFEIVKKVFGKWNMKKKKEQKGKNEWFKNLLTKLGNY